MIDALQALPQDPQMALGMAGNSLKHKKCNHHSHSPRCSQDRPVVPDLTSLLQSEAFTDSLTTAVTAQMPFGSSNTPSKESPRCPSSPSSESELDQEKKGAGSVMCRPSMFVRTC